ncbi:MAG: sulfatase-like hydrolase/transferase [Spirosomataceae bacterium]
MKPPFAEVFKRGYAYRGFWQMAQWNTYPYYPNGRGDLMNLWALFGALGRLLRCILEHNGFFIVRKGRMADDLTDRAMAYIEQNQKKPFLLYLPFNTPHSPMQVPTVGGTNSKIKPFR